MISDAMKRGPLQLILFVPIFSQDGNDQADDSYEMQTHLVPHGLVSEKYAVSNDSKQKTTFCQKSVAYITSTKLGCQGKNLNILCQLKLVNIATAKN